MELWQNLSLSMMQARLDKEVIMEQEMTMKELIALLNDQKGEFIIHVKLGEEADADATDAGSRDGQLRT